MSESEASLRELDAAYQPFPTFQAWGARQHIDFSRWRIATSLLAERAKASSGLLDRARHVATRAAAIDTGAIENLYEADRGFTFTVAFETTGWELEVSARGEQVRPLFEAQLNAYEYVLSLATQAEPMSEAAIRELHVQICAAQPTYRVETSIGPMEQPLPKGIYKALPNHVRTRKGVNHAYAPVDMTPSEMHRLVLEMRTEDFLAANPVMQAAYVHYCLVVIHPFADGNGRVARALASAFTYRAISIPIVILTDQKTSYLDSLEQADRGDFEIFTKFMLARSLDSAELVLDGLRIETKETSDQLIADIADLFDRPILLRSQVDQLGATLLEIIHQALARSAKKLNLSEKIKLDLSYTKIHYGTKDTDYRSAPTDLVLSTRASTIQPARASIDVHLVVFLPNKAERESDIRIANYPDATVFTARIEQLHPVVSGVLQLRADLFAERHWAKVLAALRPLAEQALEKQT